MSRARLVAVNATVLWAVVTAGTTVVAWVVPVPWTARLTGVGVVSGWWALLSRHLWLSAVYQVPTPVGARAWLRIRKPR